MLLLAKSKRISIHLLLLPALCLSLALCVAQVGVGYTHTHTHTHTALAAFFAGKPHSLYARRRSAASGALFSLPISVSQEMLLWQIKPTAINRRRIYTHSYTHTHAVTFFASCKAQMRIYPMIATMPDTFHTRTLLSQLNLQPRVT
jgi:hypothetical protein